MYRQGWGRLANHGLKHALIVTDDNLVEAGKVELLKGILACSQIDFCVYFGVNTEGHREGPTGGARDADVQERNFL